MPLSDISVLILGLLSPRKSGKLEICAYSQDTSTLAIAISNLIPRHMITGLKIPKVRGRFATITTTRHALLIFRHYFYLKELRPEFSRDKYPAAALIEGNTVRDILICPAGPPVT